MNIGIKIKILRENSSLSQSQLAFELGISQGTLHNIESGHSKKIDFLLMNKICQFFDKEFNYFLDEKIVNEKHKKSVHLNDFQGIHLDKFKNLIIRHKENEQIIDDLKNKLSLKK